MRGAWVLVAGVASAAGTSFYDDFLAFAEARRTKGDHNLGRSYLNPANVDVAGETRGSRYPGARWRGPRFSPTSSTTTGPTPRGCACRTPRAPSPASFSTARRTMFTTYSRGSQSHNVTRQLPSDPTAGHHTYSFRYGDGFARFIVDSQVMQTWKTGVPKGSMYLYTNLWFPNWLDGKRPLLDEYLYVDWTRYTS